MAAADNARVVIAGRQGLTALDPEERFRWEMLMRAALAFYEDVFLQFLEGLVDAEFWEARVSALVAGLEEDPGLRDWWQESEHFYHPAFRKAVANLVAA